MGEIYSLDVIALKRHIPLFLLLLLIIIYWKF